MPLKNKDGTVYQLSSPNPLVKSQKWVEDDLIFHNLEWKTINIPDKAELLPFVSDFKTPKVEKPSSQTPLVNAKLPKPVIEPVTVDEPVPVSVTVSVTEPVIKKPEIKVQQENVVVMHCLPVVSINKEDDLYGERYKKIEYGEKFTFESVMVQREDLYMIFWTNVNLVKNSIVFPSKYKTGTKFGDYRWWKVGDKKERAGGWMIQAIISEDQPDFSD